MYGIIGNGETCAFVSIFDSIDWLCLPRFDSPTVFARALDSERRLFALPTSGGTLAVPGRPAAVPGGHQRPGDDEPVGDDTVRTIDSCPSASWAVAHLRHLRPPAVQIARGDRPEARLQPGRPEPAVTGGLTVIAPGRPCTSSSPESSLKRRLTFDVEPP